MSTEKSSVQVYALKFFIVITLNSAVCIIKQFADKYALARAEQKLIKVLDETAKNMTMSTSIIFSNASIV